MISLSTDLTQNIHALVVQPQIFPTEHTCPSSQNRAPSALQPTFTGQATGTKSYT